MGMKADGSMKMTFVCQCFFGIPEGSWNEEAITIFFETESLLGFRTGHVFLYFGNNLPVNRLLKSGGIHSTPELGGQMTESLDRKLQPLGRFETF